MPITAMKTMAPPMVPTRIAICFFELRPDFWGLCGGGRVGAEREGVEGEIEGVGAKTERGETETFGAEVVLFPLVLFEGAAEAGEIGADAGGIEFEGEGEVGIKASKSRKGALSCSCLL